MPQKRGGWFGLGGSPSKAEDPAPAVVKKEAPARETRSAPPAPANPKNCPPGPPKIAASCALVPPTGGDPIYVEAVYAAFSPRMTSALVEPVWADPSDASAPLTNGSEVSVRSASLSLLVVNSLALVNPLPPCLPQVRGCIALVARGAVDWFTKARHAEVHCKHRAVSWASVLEFLTKLAHLLQAAGAVGVIFVNSVESLDPLPVASPNEISGK
jgi:hypothetical protein